MKDRQRLFPYPPFGSGMKRDGLPVVAVVVESTVLLCFVEEPAVV